MKKAGNFKFDFVNKKIEGTKSAIDRANKGNTSEFRELSEMITLCPTFDVVVIERKINNKNKGLTIARMKEFIRLMPDSDEILAEFELQARVAEVVGAKYPIMKKWFLSRFPEYKSYEACINEEDATDAEIEVNNNDCENADEE